MNLEYRDQELSHLQPLGEFWQKEQVREAKTELHLSKMQLYKALIQLSSVQFNCAAPADVNNSYSFLIIWEHI